MQIQLLQQCCIKLLMIFNLMRLGFQSQYFINLGDATEGAWFKNKASHVAILKQSAASVEIPEDSLLQGIQIVAGKVRALSSYIISALKGSLQKKKQQPPPPQKKSFQFNLSFIYRSLDVCWCHFCEVKTPKEELNLVCVVYSCTSHTYNKIRLIKQDKSV